jgi:hypothetical protein
MPNPSIFARDPTAPTTNEKRRFAIHPGIGIARMGNSPDSFFIGPEMPGVDANWDDATGQFKSFRDAQGRILRQGARFRVFEYFWDEATQTWGNPSEVTLGTDVADIQWRVHLANRKASFYVFDGQNGAEDNYVKRSKLPADKQIKKDPDRTNLRNADVAPDDRAAKLEIDPREKVISARQGGSIEVSSTNPSYGTRRKKDHRIRTYVDLSLEVFTTPRRRPPGIGVGGAGSIPGG